MSYSQPQRFSIKHCKPINKVSPENCTDHELLLQILDEMKSIREFARASSAAIWGKQDDNKDGGLVGRVQMLENVAVDNSERSKKNDERLDAVEDFIISIQAGMKTWGKIAAIVFGIFSSLTIALTVSAIAFIWALITGEFVLVMP